MYTDGGIGAAESCVHMTLASLQQVVSSLNHSPEPSRPPRQRWRYIVERTTAEELLTRDWMESCGLVVMPGGRDLPYVAKLHGKGNERIRDFVSGGGGYLGLCAGGYYGASSINFAPGNPQLEVVGPRELGFFPGVAEGPTFPGFQYDSNAGARAAVISLTAEGMRIMGSPEDERGRDGSLPAYYNGGCYFTLKSEPQSLEESEASNGTFSRNPFNVLATYSPEPPSLPWGVVACRVGRGRAVLSGLHLEASPDALRECFNGDEYLDSVLPRLEACEKRRQQLFTGIVKHLLQED